MTKFASVASRLILPLPFCALLVLNPHTATAQCPPWEELRKDESVIDLTISDPNMVGLRMWVVYVSLASLGRCTLGTELFETVTPELTASENHHVFWIGAEGPALHLFRLERIYMIQGARRYDVINSIELDTPTAVLDGMPRLTAEALVTVEGLVDFTDPVTIFYEGEMGTVPGEYWFPDTSSERGVVNIGPPILGKTSSVSHTTPDINSKRGCVGEANIPPLDGGKV